MRRIVSLLVALLMCVMMAIPALAAGTTFVPSISYKDGPEVVESTLGDAVVTNCIIVTSLREAKEKSTDIGQDDRDLLWDVYNQLSDGSMELEVDGKKYVVRELVDVNFKEEACIRVSHGHEEELEKEKTTVDIVLDMDLPKGVELKVFMYKHEKWMPVEVVAINDDTVTCVFEHFCPVAFVVEAGQVTESPKTGDAVGANLIYWIALMAASVVALIFLVINRRKFVR